jgi:hypothetical protein
MKIKLLKQHKKTCYYVRKQPENPGYRWFLDTYNGLNHTNLSAAGDKRGSDFRWIPFICQDTTCGAHGLIRVGAIEEFIQQLLEEPTP